MDKIRNGSLVVLMLAFFAMAGLAGCAGTDEGCKCAKDHPAYPDCCG